MCDVRFVYMLRAYVHVQQHTHNIYMYFYTDTLWMFACLSMNIRPNGSTVYNTQHTHNTLVHMYEFKHISTIIIRSSIGITTWMLAPPYTHTINESIFGVAKYTKLSKGQQQKIAPSTQHTQHTQHTQATTHQIKKLHSSTEKWIESKLYWIFCMRYAPLWMEGGEGGGDGNGNGRNTILMLNQYIMRWMCDCMVNGGECREKKKSEPFLFFHFIFVLCRRLYSTSIFIWKCAHDDERLCLRVRGGGGGGYLVLHIYSYRGLYYIRYNK